MGIFKKITSLFKVKDIKEQIDEFEDILLESGLSPKMVYDILDELHMKRGKISSKEECISLLYNMISQYTLPYSMMLPQERHIFLFVGVNGVGKTTSLAKFIYYLQHTHHVDVSNIVVAAGDTFRAGAIAQLGIHCNTLGVHMIQQSVGADPAAVIYDTMSYSKSKDIQYVIADTAGRMHNRKDLIAQLQKIYRLLQKDVTLSQITTFIVLDGNNGLNTLTQVEDFSEAIPIQASILSKYDGSAKGGTIVSVMQKYKLPCAFLGIGEMYSDFKIFNTEEFLNEFLTN